jgi:hypothetical protein
MKKTRKIFDFSPAREHLREKKCLLRTRAAFLKNGVFVGMVLLALFFSKRAEAQIPGLNAFFAPGMRAGVEVLPASGSDSLTLQRAYLGFIFPLGGKTKLSLRELEASHKQSFLTLNTGVRRITSPLLHVPAERVGNLTVGFTQVYARLGKGILFYTVNGGLLQNTGTKPNFFATAAFAKIKVKGLRKQNIYGFALAYSFGNVLPVPILGFNRKLGKKWDTHVLLPMSADISFKASKKLNFTAETSLKNFRTYLTLAQYPVFDRQNFQLFFPQTVLHADWDFGKRTQLRLTAGCAYAGAVRTYEEKKLLDSRLLSPAPIFSAQVKIDLGKSLLSSQLFGNDL